MPIPTKKELEEKNKSAEVSPATNTVTVPVAVPSEIPSDIVLHFRSPVEVTINGTRYEGKVITVKNMETAAEIVRIAKEGYGSTILI